MKALRLLTSIGLCALLTSCQGGSSGGPSNDRFDPRSKPAACNGAPTVSSIYGEWTSQVGASSHLNLTIAQADTSISFWCEMDKSAFGMGTKARSRVHDQNEFSLNSTGPLVAYDNETNKVCDRLEDIGGTYAYSFEGTCLVLRQGDRLFRFVPQPPEDEE